MTLANEYTNQNTWRDWTSYIKMLPIKGTDTILDLGCGTGHVSMLLSEQVLKVISTDANTNYGMKQKGETAKTILSILTKT